MLQGPGNPAAFKGWGNFNFNSLSWRAFCVLLALGILFIDSLTPLGFATGSLYLIPLMMAALGASEAFMIGFAVAASVLTVIGFFLSPPGIDLFYVLVNRALSIIEIALLCATSIVVKRQLAWQGETSHKLVHSQTLIDEQRKLLTIAADTARMGGWRIKLPEMKVEWSDFICELMGVPQGYSPTLEEAREFVAPEWRDIVSDDIQRALQYGKPFDVEAEQISRNGRRIWVRITGEVICDTDGRAVSLQGFTQDLSVEKENQYILGQ
ncbi:MAG: PAS domain-containing protein, partial [Pseudomonadota bacterium]|nr:PAS domain-containing protein [Pseudomonadota bacterium]